MKSIFSKMMRIDFRSAIVYLDSGDILRTDIIVVFSFMTDQTAG